MTVTCPLHEKLAAITWPELAQNLPDAIRKLLALKQHKTCLMQSGNYWLTKISTKLA